MPERPWLKTEVGYCGSCAFANEEGECTQRPDKKDGHHKFDFSDVPEWAEQIIKKHVGLIKYIELVGIAGPCVDWHKVEN
jgi:hypothetical protein